MCEIELASEPEPEIEAGNVLEFEPSWFELSRICNWIGLRWFDILPLYLCITLAELQVTHYKLTYTSF